MQRDVKSYLWDIKEAGTAINTFLAGKTFEDYAKDPLLRAAVERKFGIIGEALAQAKRHFPDVVGDIGSVAQIIGFRNRIIHGYEDLDDEAVWKISRTSLPRLLTEIEGLHERS